MAAYRRVYDSRQLQADCKNRAIEYGLPALQVGTSNIQPSSVVRDLVVYMDSELTMKEHVAKIAAACFYHIRRLRQVRRRVGQEVTAAGPGAHIVQAGLL